MHSNVIKLLPDSLANQIAAGEVIQRPASAVKELLENAVDAKATSITLFIEDAGKRLIQVIDNGVGMSYTDARMCFERHATSKISTSDDLFNINTFGFRGEALASIAAVALVTLKTKQQESELGTIFEIDGAVVKKHEACATNNGTNLSIQNLFYNVPARKNFLKSNTVEIQHITEEFYRVALANPHIKMEFISNDQVVRLLKEGNLRQRISAIWGRKYDELLIPLQEMSDSFLSVSGFLVKPEGSKKRKGEQYFFANKRFIKSSYLNHAIASAFEGLIPKDYHVGYCVFLEVEPKSIDINIHPTKTEVKFQHEKSIYAILHAITKKSLTINHISPNFSFEKENLIQEDKENNKLSFNNPSIFLKNFTKSSNNQQTKQDWDNFYKILSEDSSNLSNSNEDSKEEQELFEIDNQEKFTSSLQLNNTYIISTLKSGIIIINQFNAHFRILYEKYLDSYKNQEIITQKLLFPELINLSQKDYNTLVELLPDLNALGFLVEDFGKGSLLLTGLPVSTPQNIAKKIFEDVVSNYLEFSQNLGLSTAEQISISLAKSMAIKSGFSLPVEAQQQFINELFQCQMPFYTPDGKPVFIQINSSELEKKFNI
jgi:DNA mismatch repair protein MutL